MNNKAPVCLLILIVSFPLCAADEFMSISGGGWYGWGASLEDYFLSGASEALDLRGQTTGGNIRGELNYSKDLFTAAFWFDYTGSYLLTGGQYDVLRQLDLSLGASIRLSAFRYLQPYLSAGILYSDYLLFLPYHPHNSSLLHLYGFRLTGGVLSELFALDFVSFELGFQIGPEYVLEILFSDTVIFLHEIRGRICLEMRFR